MNNTNSYISINRFICDPEYQRKLIYWFNYFSNEDQQDVEDKGFTKEMFHNISENADKITKILNVIYVDELSSYKSLFILYYKNKIDQLKKFVDNFNQIYEDCENNMKNDKNLIKRDLGGFNDQKDIFEVKNPYALIPEAINSLQSFIKKLEQDIGKINTKPLIFTDNFKILSTINKDIKDKGFSNEEIADLKTAFSFLLLKGFALWQVKVKLTEKEILLFSNNERNLMNINEDEINNTNVQKYSEKKYLIIHVYDIFESCNEVDFDKLDQIYQNHSDDEAGQILKPLMEELIPYYKSLITVEGIIKIMYEFSQYYQPFLRPHNYDDFGYTKVKDVFIVSNKLKSFELIFLGSGNDKNDDNDDDDNDDHNGEKNSLSHIPLKINTEILTRLNLSNNKLERISPNVFELPNLIYLNVEKNRLTDLPRQVSHSKLLFLNVSENPFEKLKFDLPMSIMTFYCSSCKLKEIPLSFTDCESLCILYCMDNEIEKLPDLPYIGMINASNNKIKEFPVLPKCIQQIDLSLNLIEKVPENINNLKGIIELDLSYNKLKKLPDIQNLTSLTFLKLSHNFDLEGEIDLQPFEKIETVDISFTKMTVNDIPVDVIRELIISYPSDASNQINDPNSRGLQTPIVFTYPQIKVMTECDFTSYSEMRGTRETMEDAILVRPLITKNCDVYALLDGHGGSDTSNYGIFKIAELFNQMENFDVTEESVKNVVANLIDSLKKQNFGDGATMALAVLTENKVVAANLGDSRVLLIGKNGDIKFSLRDHKPVFRDEIDRILSVGGKIVCGRVDGVLAVSRCLGDFSIRGVSYDPEMVIRDIDDDEDRWLVLCCDGVFDVVSNEDVAEIAKTAKNAADLAYRLRNTAAVRLSTDNISAIAVDLKERNKKASKMKLNKEE